MIRARVAREIGLEDKVSSGLKTAGFKSEFCDSQSSGKLRFIVLPPIRFEFMVL